MLDVWQTEVLNVSFGEHHGTPDMKLTRHDKAHFCWSTQEGTVRTAVYRPTGVWTTSLVDTVATSNASDLVDCALGVTPNELPRVLYADGDDLKMGRYALQSATYFEGPRWHTRTIMEDVSPTHLALDITPDGLEWGLMRTADGALHQVNFSGAYWTDYLLEAAPSERILNSKSTPTVSPTCSTQNQPPARWFFFASTARTTTAASCYKTTTSQTCWVWISMPTTSSRSPPQPKRRSFSINLIRSLQAKTRVEVNPVPSTAIEGEDDEDEGLMLLGDFNDDGLMIWSFQLLKPTSCP